MLEVCEHKYVFGGVRFRDTGRLRPGSGAVTRIYGNVYFCEHCLTKRTERLNVEANSYQPVEYGATPAATDELMLDNWER